MKIISFTYTKSPDEVSERTLVIASEPTKMFSGTDISSLDMDDQVAYLNKLEKARADYMEDIAMINAKFDLRHNFRQFDPAKMTNIVREEI